MLQRAIRAFPGVVMSVLLANPAFAAHTTTHPSTQPHRVAQSPKQTSRKTPAKRLARTRRPISAPAFTAPIVTADDLNAEQLDHGPTLTIIANTGTGTGTGTGTDSVASTAPASSTSLAATPALSDGVWHQTGMASWYGGKRWQGHRTANGERYDQDDLTAAHATLPIGSRVRVTMQGSNRSVIVTINDRPGTRSRIIDLSRGAAKELGILNQGVAEVTLSMQ